jgi:rubredoxin
MVSETERDEMTWYECEACGLLFDTLEDAKQHEANCDAEEPTYIQ